MAVRPAYSVDKGWHCRSNIGHGEGLLFDGELLDLVRFAHSTHKHKIRMIVIRYLKAPIFEICMKPTSLEEKWPITQILSKGLY